MNILTDLKDKVKRLFSKETAGKIVPEIQVSEPMITAVNTWFKLFYQRQTTDKIKGSEQTRFAKVLTNYMATLATNELKISAGTGTRAEYINEQIMRFVMPSIRVSTQLAGTGGQIILKPFVSGKNILCEAVTADRFYPTRINCAKIAEAGFFTDFDELAGKKVVRIEKFDLQPEGMYINNRAYYESANGLGAEIRLSDVDRWNKLPSDILIKNIDRPLFAQIQMPFANTVDNTSLLPVSIYADSVDAIQELDRIYSEFLWEIHTGKRRKIIDSTAIKPNNGKKENPKQDMATDEYIVLNLMGSNGLNVKPFDDYTPEIRADYYQKAIDIQLRLIEMQCGFSAGTFTFDIRTGKVTATQIISEDKDTYNTIKTIQSYGMQRALCDLIYVYDVYATLYNLAPNGKITPSVSFGDSVFEDTSVEFARRKQLADSGYLKKEKLIAWYFDISEEEAVSDYLPPAADDNIFGDEF